MKSKTVTFPVFSNYTIYIHVGNIEKAIKRYPQTKDFNIEDTEAIAIHDTSTGVSFLFLPDTASAGTIAHESWHAVNQMMNHLGVDIDSETVAYHLGYLVDNISSMYD